AERLAAMLSVHAYAYWPDGRFPDGLSTMKLDDAVDILLHDDEDRLAPSRRRRAIGKLAGYALQQFETVVGRLGGDAVRIRTALDAQSAIYGNRFRLNAAARETFVDDMYADLTAPDCHWKELRYDVGSNGPVISVT